MIKIDRRRFRIPAKKQNAHKRRIRRRKYREFISVMASGLRKKEKSKELRACKDEDRKKVLRREWGERRIRRKVKERMKERKSDWRRRWSKWIEDEAKKRIFQNWKKGAKQTLKEEQQELSRTKVTNASKTKSGHQQRKRNQHYSKETTIGSKMGRRKNRHSSDGRNTKEHRRIRTRTGMGKRIPGVLQYRNPPKDERRTGKKRLKKWDRQAKQRKKKNRKRAEAIAKPMRKQDKKKAVEERKKKEELEEGERKQKLREKGKGKGKGPSKKTNIMRMLAWQ